MSQQEFNRLIRPGDIIVRTDDGDPTVWYLWDGAYVTPISVGDMTPGSTHDLVATEGVWTAWRKRH